MKKIIVVFVLFLIFSGCDSENAGDCMQTEGAIITKEIDLPAFEEISIYDRVKLFISYGEEQKVVLETGENLADEVYFSVEENQLQIKNENTCNLFRDYEVTKIYVTVPNLTYLRNGSQYSIEGMNVLAFEEILLISEDGDNTDEFHSDGDFKLQLHSANISIVNNNMSNYYLSGEVNHLNIGFYAGDGRLEGAGLVAQRVNVYHRGSNKIIVNPQESLTGTLTSTGDLIAKNEPSTVEVEQLYTGRLIFEIP